MIQRISNNPSIIYIWLACPWTMMHQTLLSFLKITYASKVALYVSFCADNKGNEVEVSKASSGISCFFI